VAELPLVERLLDPQSGTPQHDDQPADPIAAEAVSGATRGFRGRPSA
jgi:hypothetical protein